ncbi:DNA-binding transcriptional regulator, LacI/PurR family [Verrucomicrobium sp. GAS474]|uniref:substrate-binding domain-containing protein n=1 Tax=Verrucomicrobium sp. GAS474 TaxID=1882831 RepID=UPI00087C87E3|nr:substrate-binding domain-containing protein [Verrucomicrobium sp. GAS474]SDT88503.1 DNA-binding transcriptional regulator, LacI/PurR family [Verrucomicrobium sp. GAS474]
MAAGTLVNGAEALLRAWLKEHGIGEGDRLPSERDFAKTLGIQHYALNRAMARLIAEGLVVREGYKLFGAARKAPAAAFACHLILAHRSHYLPNYRKIAKELGIDLVVHRWETTEEIGTTLQRLDPERTEGIVLDPPFGYDPHHWEEAATALARRGVPLVCIDTPARELCSILGDPPRSLALIVDHLHGLGHRELALTAPSPWTSALAEILDTWKSLCRQHGLPASAKRIASPDRAMPLREDFVDLADRLDAEWSDVTALVCAHNASNIPPLLEILSLRKKQVPRDLSLLSLRDSAALRTLVPPIGAAESDINLIRENALLMVQSLARKRNRPGAASAPFQIRIQPQLIVRGSTAPGPAVWERKPSGKAKSPPPGEAPHEKTIPPRPEFPPEAELEAMRRRPYDRVARIDAARFLQLDLQPHMNRPLNYRRGWLGDLPLKHIPPGLHSIHGVPFHIRGGPRRSDCGAVIFQSTVNVQGSARELPSALRVPVEAKVRALYFLHGCGYARFLRPFGAYRFYRGQKRIGEIPLVPLGQPPAEYPSGVLSPAFLKANIQDWWSDLPHFDLPGARVAPFNQSEPTDAAQRHAYLYTLEWINPEPEKPLDEIEVAIDPTQSTTLGLLAISALRV